MFALSGCGGSALPASPGPAGPANAAAGAQSALAAQTTAQTEFGLLSGGDYGHAWDLWSDPAKQVISRADFIKLNTACPIALGVPTKIVAARPNSDSNVEIDWQRGPQTGTAQMTYTDGAWRFTPPPEDYQHPLATLLAQRRATNHCPEPPS